MHGCAFLCNWVKFVDIRVSCGKSPNTLVICIKLMTNFLPMFYIISIETIRRREGFHEIIRFTEVFCFHGYWKGILTRKIINILNINCTRDKFTPMKYCIWGNLKKKNKKKNWLRIEAYFMAKIVLWRRLIFEDFTWNKNYGNYYLWIKSHPTEIVCCFQYS